MDTLPRPIELDWHSDACARIPYRVYTDAGIYERELERVGRQAPDVRSAGD